MSDITKCKGTNCYLKETCYRYTAPSCPYRQSVFVDVPIHDKDSNEKCKYYWEDGYSVLLDDCEYKDE